MIFRLVRHDQSVGNVLRTFLGQADCHTGRRSTAYLLQLLKGRDALL